MSHFGTHHSHSQIPKNPQWESKKHYILSKVVFWLLSPTPSDMRDPWSVWPFIAHSGPLFRETTLDLKQTHHVMHSTVFLQNQKKNQLFGSRLKRRSSLRWEKSERHPTPSFDVPILFPPLMCLTFSKIRLCSFTVARLPNYSGDLKGGSKWGWEHNFLAFCWL